MDDLDKYVLEQAKIEVEHTRSWPTKILAFYVAINAGIVTAVFSLTGRTQNPVSISPCVRLLLAGAMLSVLVWAIFLLAKNHKNYLRNRNFLVHFQTANKKALEEKFAVPTEWVLPYEVSLLTRWSGRGFYEFLVCLLAILGIAGVWVI